MSGERRGLAIQRIQHVSLPIPGDVESIAVARRFYGDVLGLEEIARPDVFPAAGLWYGLGGQELHLFGEPSGVAVNAESLRHPCFEVEDVDALRKHLEITGVPTRDDDGEIPGRARFFGLDPFGNTLEFVHFAADHW
jgi:catechol 2,3-dioxygenase-like lactoylglutathione lyase family enzyme